MLYKCIRNKRNETGIENGKEKRKIYKYQNDILDKVRRFTVNFYSKSIWSGHVVYTTTFIDSILYNK